jgi:group I intron endonuclease
LIEIENLKEEPAIYVLKNKINNEKYVGQTKNLKQRLKKHKSINPKQYIDRAIREYGWENFEIYIFPTVVESLDYLESKFIRDLNTLDPNGYNLDTGGKNKKFCEGYKKRLSKPRRKGRKPTYGFKGHKHSETTKLEIGVSMTGKFKGENNPMFGRCSEKAPMFGKHTLGFTNHKHSEDSKSKMYLSKKD